MRAAIVEAGEDFGLRQVGSRVYATNTLESGWIPCPLPAVFTGDEHEGVPRVAARERLRGHGLARRQLLLRRHRRLLPDAATTSATGRSSSSTTTSSAATRSRRWPTSRSVKRSPSHGTARTSPGRSARSSRRATRSSTSTSRCRTTRPGPYDKVLRDGETVGISTFSGYSYNERSFLSLAMVDLDLELGTEVTLVWGEEDGGSSKPVVERTCRPRSAPSSARALLGGRAHLVPRRLAHQGRSGLRQFSCEAARACSRRLFPSAYAC